MTSKKCYPCVELIDKENNHYWKSVKNAMNDEEADEWIEKERLYFISKHPDESFVSKKIKYIPIFQNFIAKYDSDYAFPENIKFC